jgi:hypothetical protein
MEGWLVAGWPPHARKAKALAAGLVAGLQSAHTQSSDRSTRALDTYRQRDAGPRTRQRTRACVRASLLRSTNLLVFMKTEKTDRLKFKNCKKKVETLRRIVVLKKHHKNNDALLGWLKKPEAK